MISLNAMGFFVFVDGCDVGTHLECLHSLPLLPTLALLGFRPHLLLTSFAPCSWLLSFAPVSLGFHPVSSPSISLTVEVPTDKVVACFSGNLFLQGPGPRRNDSKSTATAMERL